MEEGISLESHLGTPEIRWVLGGGDVDKIIRPLSWLWQAVWYLCKKVECTWTNRKLDVPTSVTLFPVFTLSSFHLSIIPKVGHGNQISISLKQSHSSPTSWLQSSIIKIVALHWSLKLCNTLHACPLHPQRRILHIHKQTFATFIII